MSGNAQRDLLVERLQVGLYIILVGILLFAATDPVVHPDRVWPLRVIIVAELALVIGVLWRLRFPLGARGAIRLAVLVVSFFCISTAASGVISDDAATTPVLLLVLTMGAGTLLPWGVGPQLLVHAVAAVAILWNVAAVEGVSAAGSQPIAVVMGTIAGVYAARTTGSYQLARRRTEKAEAEARARQHQGELAQAARLSTLGGMAAGLAHEINQPLAAIVSYARGSARRIAGGEVRAETILPAMEAIVAQALRAAEVLKRIHAFVRLGEVPRERTDLNALVRDALRFAEVEARQRGVDIRLEPTERALEVEVDPVQIEQVVLNLVRNGFEAMTGVPSADRRLTIRTGLSGEHVAQVSVSDTGPGVPPGMAQRLFDPFFSTKREGLGLGLSISRSIVEAHDGRLAVASDVPHGATFWMDLPLADRYEGVA